MKAGYIIDSNSKQRNYAFIYQVPASYDDLTNELKS